MCIRDSDCIGSNCVADDTFVSFPTVTQSLVKTGTLEWVLSASTTITTDDMYFRFSLDPNSPPVDFAYNATNFSTGASMNGYNYSTTNLVPTLKFCLGTCDNNDFSPVPNVSASPWVRLVSPLSGSTHLGGTSVPLNFQFNTGTSSIDKIVVRYSSTIQSLIPYEYNVALSGISEFSITQSFPFIGDTILVVIDMMVGTSTVYTSSTYTLNVTTNPQEVDLGTGMTLPPACDNLLVGVICDIAVWLFYPNDFAGDYLSTSFDVLYSQKPFNYFSQATDLLVSTASTTSSTTFHSLTITVPLIGTTLPIFTKESLDAIYPSDTRLMIRDVMAKGLWILLILSLVYMLLNIFSDAVYQGEQAIVQERMESIRASLRKK